MEADVRTIPRLLRLPAVLEIFPVGRTVFLEGVKNGVYPRPRRMSPRTVAWREEDIRNLVNSLEAA
jgi:predicted DNA-binding transcriptional regulator AlpA